METIAVVDAENVIIGQMPMDRLYDGPNNHRIVHVLIFNNRGDIALQLRSQTEDYLPSHWTTVVGGHVRVGETSEQAARREMKEEVGLDIPLEKLFEMVYEPPSIPGMKKFLTVFKASYTGSFTLDPREVERVEFFSPDKIMRMIERKEKMHQEMASVINHLLDGKS